ncbi:MAG: XRE family transcriptional regulator [Rhodococcus sp. (in: high G+C Gram-positive bacteria)]|uniref:helix-turn-helix transcriptional regulator n=1 Tax=Rhodococcus sp. TaxID=1831 RepID=UPI003BB01485
MIHYLSLRDVAAKSNLTINTIKGYARKGLLPHPDATVGTHRGWLEETIEQWINDRRTAKTRPESTNSADP